MNPDDSPQTVSYTVKELLARIDVKIDKLATALDQKASQTSVDILDTRLSALEAEVQNLKSTRAQLMAIVALMSFVIPVAVALIVHYA